MKTKIFTFLELVDLSSRELCWKGLMLVVDRGRDSQNGQDNNVGMGRNGKKFSSILVGILLTIKISRVLKSYIVISRKFSAIKLLF